ncbi:hypothetical protein LRS11_21780 [Pseudomonas sp. J452]|uniref:hypothetical protein n=1 Tax=Pseudomonas sp. J452 TaxID=2898441 RepID=UPI0021AD51D8|nr:hypothetical protein [Pseudomonas sp. J452]UUY08387.1 hypothetical protein LRS11_21780 [Pseudomonas sp. J452]
MLASSVESKENVASQLLDSPDFAKIISKIRAANATGLCLSEAIDNLVSLDGRQLVEFGLQSLSPIQQTVLNLAGANRLSACSADDADEGDRSAWYLGVWDYGRIYLDNKLPESACCRVFARVTLVDEQVELVEQAIIDHASVLDSEKKIVEEFFATMSGVDILIMFERVYHAIDHIDPVLLYISDHTFTNFDKYNNLLAKGGKHLPGHLLTDLRSLAPEQWSVQQKFAVFCIYLIAKANQRVEEFNGRQLTPLILDKHFNEKIHEYEALLQKKTVFSLFSLERKAEYLKELKAWVRQEHFIYRNVNGLNFHKTERYATRAALDLSVGNMPDKVRSYIEDRYGIHVARFADIDELFASVIQAIADHPERYAPEHDLSAVEQLLKMVVLSAVEELASDIGMTRSPRDLMAWSQMFAQEHYEAICDLPTTDYFCAVFPSPQVRQQLSSDGDLLFRIVYAIAGRMTFNSWHYTPGHCPLERVPEGRHFYLPPRMSDTAQWSDQHHSGHRMARVRYSIRSPAGLMVNGRKQYGVVDLRLMRMDGAPYNDKELMRAREYTAYLRSIYQSMMDIALAKNCALAVQSFSKDWYKANC